MSLKVQTVETESHAGQKPGTSGLRKKTRDFLRPGYTEAFLQALLRAQASELPGSALAVGGDGRYLTGHVVRLAARLSAANGVSKLFIGQNGILSTPAVSALIISQKILGGIVLTASHNPGGIDNDFGIKFNCANGGPAPDQTTNEIYKLTLDIKDYRIVPDLEFPLDKIGQYNFDIDGSNFEINIIDSVENYVALMKDIFDFDKLKSLIKGTDQRKPFNVLIDSMNGVTGPYVERIFIDELGANANNVTRTKPLEDFGGIHPDPNLTYAADLVEKVKAGGYDFGVAFDGDGDRNMILGKSSFFVTPSDSLAVLGDNLDCIPYFKKNGCRGYARSMPTAAAIDRVAEKLDKDLYEVPTGWKYFGNLMDADKLSLCGEESFGTGSNHIREKDGIWACLSWLSVISETGKSVEQILNDHWKKYGRNYFSRYDYEECASDPCNQMMADIETKITDPSFVGKLFTQGSKSYKVKLGDNFSYVDPVDKSVTTKQGLRIIFEDGSRIILRLSGTGSSGATVRLYIDSYESENVTGDAQVMLKPLIDVALEISELKKYTGRDKPTVIT